MINFAVSYINEFITNNSVKYKINKKYIIRCVIKLLYIYVCVYVCVIKK